LDESTHARSDAGSVESSGQVWLAGRHRHRSIHDTIHTGEQGGQVVDILKVSLPDINAAARKAYG
jgi:hypothetical protein